MSDENQKRRVGHSALRVKDGKIEKFDPHPSVGGTSRERFEKWARGLYPELTLRKELSHQNIYWNPATQQMWEVWQAAERETRERCAQMVEDFEDEKYGVSFETTFRRAVAERIKDDEK